MKKNTKDNITIGSAIGMLVFGMSLTVAGFIVEPLGEVSHSVLTVLGECLIFSGACLGLSNYVQTTVRDEVAKLRNGDNGK